MSGDLKVLKQDNAYFAGRLTKNNLVGYTTPEEYGEVLAAVRTIDKDSVKTFLAGYKSPNRKTFDCYGLITLAARTSNDPFFKQVMREFGFAEKEKVARDIAGKLRDYLQAQGRTEEANKIQQILNCRKIDNEAVEALDDVVSRTIDYNY